MKIGFVVVFFCLLSHSGAWASLNLDFETINDFEDQFSAERLGSSVKQIQYDVTNDLVNTCMRGLLEYRLEDNDGYLECKINVNSSVSKVPGYQYIINNPDIRYEIFDPFTKNPELLGTNWIDELDFSEVSPYEIPKIDIDYSEPILRATIEFDADAVWITVGKMHGDEFITLEPRDIALANTILSHKVFENDEKFIVKFKVDPPMTDLIDDWN